ncbi:hypothetical protein ASZ90_010146 [hydrocarbon metagenome]|uniref:Uncharacterized protein n=1 Tax=hydrocarbon metagenome TaxID=938273 RepID=A0A0W8FGW8_9ZZZZ
MKSQGSLHTGGATERQHLSAIWSVIERCTDMAVIGQSP